MVKKRIFYFLFILIQPMLYSCSILKKNDKKLNFGSYKIKRMDSSIRKNIKLVCFVNDVRQKMPIKDAIITLNDTLYLGSTNNIGVCEGEIRAGIYYIKVFYLGIIPITTKDINFDSGNTVEIYFKIRSTSIY